VFPLVQLPKKFKALLCKGHKQQPTVFPLVQLPKKFKGLRPLPNCCYMWFPLVQLPKKFKVVVGESGELERGFH